MQKTEFDTDSYEQDLALIMLESIMKKRLISSQTYRSVKNMVGKEDTNGCCEDVGRATKIAV